MNDTNQKTSFNYNEQEQRTNKARTTKKNTHNIITDQPKKIRATKSKAKEQGQE